MRTNFKLLVILLFALPSIAFSQRNPARNVVGVQQLDPRFTFSIEKYWSGMADAESYYYYVTNNTSDEYMLEIEVDLTLNCYDAKPYKLGFNKQVYLKPNGEFTPDDDWVHNYMITSDKEKQKSCLIKIGDTYTLYRGHTWQIKSVVNLTQKKAAEEKKKEDEKLKKIEEDNKRKKEAEDKRKQAEEDKKKADDQKKKVEDDKKKADDQKKKEEKSNTKDGTSKQTSSEEKNDVESKEEKKKKEAEEAQKTREEKEAARIEAQERAAQEERERRARVQQEYDSWKADAQKSNDQQDLMSASATIGLFTLLGGFIYEGMGNVNPDFVYRAPINKFTPKLFVNIDVGFSFSMDPILFQSLYSTVNNGDYYSNASFKGETGYYLNLNAESRIGAGNDFYSFYGIIGGKLGIVPTFRGSRFNMEYGGGLDLGLKNVKLFGQYRGSLLNTKSMTSSDVEEGGSGELDANYTEIWYGLKFTFGGNKDDKYRRTHLSLGMISRQYTIDGTQKFYDGDTNSIQTMDIKPIQGYSFEWKQDNTFRLFIRYYDNYNYIGNGDVTSNISSSLSQNGSLFEIGFVRAIDFF